MSLAPYFSYPKTQENLENFESWNCPICTEEDPFSKGGTVAHGFHIEGKNWSDGRKHPIHRICATSWTKLCPVCRIKTDINSLIPIGKRVFSQIRQPAGLVFLGLASFFCGLKARSSALSAIGLLLQLHGTNRAILDHRRLPIELVHLIEKWANEIISDLSEEKSVGIKLNHLKRVASYHPIFQEKLVGWIDSPDREQVFSGLKKLAETAHYYKVAYQLVYIWRVLAIVGSGYFTMRSYLLQLEKLRLVLQIKNSKRVFGNHFFSLCSNNFTMER